MVICAVVAVVDFCQFHTYIGEVSAKRSRKFIPYYSIIYIPIFNYKKIIRCQN